MATPFSAELTKADEETKLDRVIRVCSAGCREGLQSLLQDGSKEDLEILLNQKNKDGTTPLHEACRHGYLDCIKLLLKYKACANIWDEVRGFPPVLCAVYNDHNETVELLMSSQACEVNCKSRYGEMPLHLACLRGNMKLVEYLVSQDASLLEGDCHGNTALHYASGSKDGSQLVRWLLSMSQVKDAIDWQNQFGETPAHRAASLGLSSTVSILRYHGADFLLADGDGLSASDLAERSNNRECYDITTLVDSVPSLSPSPIPPQPLLLKEGSLSRSSDAILQRSSSSQPLPIPTLAPQRSYSTEDSADSYLRSTSPELLPRRPSMTGMARPLSLSIPRRDSRTSLHRSHSRKSGDEPPIYVTKKMAGKISFQLERQESCGWEEAQQVVYDSTAYEPPVSMMTIQPVERVTLSKENQKHISNAHDVRLRITNWSKSKEETVDVCIAAAMHLNRSFPLGYTVVSPICFVSCKRQKPCKIALSLPHALHLPSSIPQDVTRTIVILSTTAVNPHLNVDSPLFGPGEQTFEQLQGIRVVVEEHSVVFKTELALPSLFAVAVKAGPIPTPSIPLRCIMSVGYPQLDRATRVAGFDLEIYIGMNLKTVTMAMMARSGMKFEEKFFNLSANKLWVAASLTNPVSEWAIEPRNNRELTYSQVALTQYRDSDSFSHRPAYPPHVMFFIEPGTAFGAVKCNITVTDSLQRELCNSLVVPYAPQKEVTPDPESRYSSQTQLINGHLISEV